MELAGKVVIVTGSGGPGSGRAHARRMAREGASVVVNDIDERGGWETVELILKEGGRASFLSADVGVESEARGLIAFAENTYGGLDVLVNNATPHPTTLRVGPSVFRRGRGDRSAPIFSLPCAAG